MSDNAARYLGFAFASADLLIELDPTGRIVVALGAAQHIVGHEQSKLIGSSWGQLFAESDRALVGALIEGLESGDRRGPVRAELQMAPGQRLKRYAAFSACRLPQLAPNISCAISLGAAAGLPARPEKTSASGLLDHDAFMEAARRIVAAAGPSGVELNVEFVELDGLTAATNKLDAAAAAAVMSRVAAAVRAESYAGENGAQLANERFALIRPRADPTDRLLKRLGDAAGRAGAKVQPVGSSATVNPDDSSGKTMRALTFAMDSFVREGGEAAGATYDSVLARTAADAGAFSRMVAERRFSLVYQPIIDLKTNEPQYFEALARFEDNENPAVAIRMAEELELIEGFDLAVADRVIRQLTARDQGRLKLAVNVSARSLMQPTFVLAILKRTAAYPSLAGRLVFEVTESSAIEDMQGANARIQSLRQRGFLVCLDDFGAGEASMPMLKLLDVDSVKIDGQHVKEMAAGKSSLFIRRLADQCRDLKIITIAERVESAAVAEGLKAIGVDYGQGWHFGKPASTPTILTPLPQSRVRRLGAQETWG